MGIGHYSNADGSGGAITKDATPVIKINADESITIEKGLNIKTGGVTLDKPLGGKTIINHSDDSLDVDVIVLPKSGTLVTDERLAKYVPLSNIASYHLLSGNLSVDNTVLTNGFGVYLYTGNTTTPPTINLDMDITSQWGNTTDETYGYLIKIKARSAIGDWTWVNSVRGITKYISSNTTAVEGTDANMFTLSTVAGITTLNIGTSARTNTNGVTYEIEVYQTTHRKSGVTNQGKAFTEHYNPNTGFTINGYEGSGLAGHEIPHSLGRKLGFANFKNLNIVRDWLTYYGADNKYMALNLTIAVTSSNVWSNAETTFNFNSGGSQYNQSGSQHIMYGWVNSYFDESGNLIGNYEIGTYTGIGAAGNKVTTRGKPASIMTKRLDSTGNYVLADNVRNTFDNTVIANGAEAEVNTNYFNSLSDGISIQGTSADINASGGQYLYMVVYDNDSGSGKSKYPKATDTANVQINNGIIPLAHGIDNNGAKNSIVVANETIAGVTYTEGKNYLYKTDTGYGVKAYEPRYLASELIRRFAGEQPDYYDIAQNKWFSTDAGTELVTNGDGSTTAGWIVGAGSAVSIQNGTLRYDRTGNTDTTIYQNIPTVIGKEYYLSLFFNIGTATLFSVLINDVVIFSSATSGLVTYKFIAQSSSTKLSFSINNSNGLYSLIDNISVFLTEIIPTTEITESRNYMNHVVHADADGRVLYVEELPKIEYKNIIVQGENRKVIELGTVYSNNRYVVENPFGNEKYMDCDVKLEVYVTDIGKWVEIGHSCPASGSSSEWYGAKSFSTSEGVVVQTAYNYILSSSSIGIVVPYAPTVNVTNAPARVIVTYVGVAK